MVGQFALGLKKVSEGKCRFNKVMVLKEEEGPVFEVCVDGRELQHTLEL